MPNTRESTGTPTLVALTRAAEILGVSPKTMRRWVADGKVPAYRVANHAIRVDRADVMQLIVRIAVAGTEQAR
jgi:excisionase family DNA binding protein